MTIDSKAEFYKLWHAGVLGNKPRSWRSLAEVDAAGYVGLLTLRHTVVAGGKSVYGVPRSSVEATLEQLAADGVPANHVTYNESAPDDQLLVQGEVMRGLRGLEMRYSTTPGISMREAMKSPREVAGVVARAILDLFLDANSLDDIDALFELYPDSVIEFGAYRHDVGCLPNRNTFFWEVRNF
jgi:hypothetical protein